MLAVKEAALMASFNAKERTVEKPSHRARRDDPVSEKTVVGARGQRTHRLECSNEVRF